jgi:hypothetical protein
MESSQRYNLPIINNKISEKRLVTRMMTPAASKDPEIAQAMMSAITHTTTTNRNRLDL